MKHLAYSIFFAVVVLLSDSLIFAQQQNGSIKIEVNGFISDDGRARILIFSTKEKDYFPAVQNKAYLKKVVPIKNKKVIAEFNDLPYGDYAISVHHDKNNDGKVNTNLLGIPNEGLGCTNDAKGFFGAPKFEKAKVRLNSKELSLIIKIVN